MDRQVRQTQSISDLTVPGVELSLGLPIVVNKEQNQPKAPTSLREVDKSKLVTFESEHFTAYGASKEQAESVATNAEVWLKHLNNEWFENKPINWPVKAEIVANVDEKLGAGGETNFNISKSGILLGIESKVQGSPERLSDSVIPHEILHILAATNFSNQLIRWADEGIATSIECSAEKLRLKDIISSDIKRIEQGLGSSLETFDKILVRITYPEDQKALLEFYAKSTSLTEFLIEREGKEHFMNFLKEANPEKTNLQHWNRLLNKYYKLDGSFELEVTWRMWARSKK